MVLGTALLGGAAVAAPVYNEVACCYSDTGSCTVVSGQLTPGLSDSSCALPTGSAWLLEVQTTAPISNPQLVQQTTEGSGWEGICPQVDGNFIDRCFTATGSPLFSNGQIKLVTVDVSSPYAFVEDCTKVPASGTCAANQYAFDSKTCCHKVDAYTYAYFTTGHGFAEAYGPTLGVFTPAPSSVPASTPVTSIALGLGLVGVGLFVLRRRWA
jgi:hypothetical protein